MVSFWEYLAEIFSDVDLGDLIFVASILLAVGAIFAGVVALALGCEKVSYRWGAWANLWYVPAVVFTGAFVVILASWLGIEVSQHV